MQSSAEKNKNQNTKQNLEGPETHVLKCEHQLQKKIRDLSILQLNFGKCQARCPSNNHETEDLLFGGGEKERKEQIRKIAQENLTNCCRGFKIVRLTTTCTSVTLDSSYIRTKFNHKSYYLLIFQLFMVKFWKSHGQQIHNSKTIMHKGASKKIKQATIYN